MEIDGNWHVIKCWPTTASCNGIRYRTRAVAMNKTLTVVWRVFTSGNLITRPLILHQPRVSHHSWWIFKNHYSDVIMGTIASQIASVSIDYLSVSTGTDQRKHQSSASLAFVRGIHRHKWSVTRKCFHLMTSSKLLNIRQFQKTPSNNQLDGEKMMEILWWWDDQWNKTVLVSFVKMYKTCALTSYNFRVAVYCIWWMLDYVAEVISRHLILM